MSFEIGQPEVIEILQESERFIVQKVVYDGRTAILKKAKTTKMAINLARELQAYGIYVAMTRLENCPFGLASVIESDDDWILLSFLEGEPMSQSVTSDNSTRYLNKVAEIMAFCDDKAGIVVDGNHLPLSSESLRRQRARLKEMRTRFMTLDGLGLGFLRPELDEAADYYEAHAQDLQTCFVNPDLTLSHVMLDGDKVSIFDFDNARLAGARFSDLINMFTKIWFLEGDKDKAIKFYETFWRIKGDSDQEHAEQVKALVFQRCFGFTDELLTPPNQYHNTRLEMTPEYASSIVSVMEWVKSL